MAFDRDLNVAFARAVRASGAPPLAGWEMLGATGVRGLRLLHESELLSSLSITEQQPEALRAIVRSVDHTPGPKVTVRAADARRPGEGGPFGYIDLDPYGSPLPYLDALLRSARPPAIAAVTATDLMVLAGVLRGTCEARYGSRPLHGRLAPEGGLRILLATLAREARARGLRITPLLCYVHDHHLRAYVELSVVGEGPSADPVGVIQTDEWDGPPLGPRKEYGPFWLGPLFDRAVVDRLEPPVMSARPREIASWIARVREEVDADRPFFYEPNELARTLGLAEPPGILPLIERLRAGGAHAARAHPRPTAFRTDAPRSTVEAAARALAARP